MCPNEVTLKRVGEGTNDIIFNYGQMKDIHIENWWEIGGFSNTRLLTAGMLSCITDSFEWELDLLEKGARYDELNSKIRWRYGKDESGRRIIDGITIEINLKVPEKLREEHEKVVEEHVNHGCTITRSVKKGIPIELVINEK